MSMARAPLQKRGAVSIAGSLPSQFTAARQRLLRIESMNMARGRSSPSPDACLPLSICPIAQVPNSSMLILQRGARPLLQNLCRILSKIRRPQSTSTQRLLERVILFGLPRLSPAMTSGRVRFLNSPGDAVECYDLLFEVDTSNLTEEHNKLGHLSGSVTLQVESQETGYLAKVLVEEGREVKVGTPIAIMAEDEEDLASISSEMQGLSKALSSPPLSDLYSSEAQAVARVATWQAYLKGKRDDSCNTCG